MSKTVWAWVIALAIIIAVVGGMWYGGVLDTLWGGGEQETQEQEDLTRFIEAPMLPEGTPIVE